MGGKHKLFVSRLIHSCIAWFIACIALVAHAGYEKFTSEGNALGTEIDQELIRRGYCKDSADCFALLPMFGGHGNGVNFSAYEIGDRNRDVLCVVVELIVRRGIIITKGIPISLRAYAESHDEHVNQAFFRSKKPILILEIAK